MAKTWKEEAIERLTPKALTPPKSGETYTDRLAKNRAEAAKLCADVPKTAQPSKNIRETIFGKAKTGGTVNPTISAADFSNRYDQMTERENAVYSHYRNSGKEKEAKNYLKAIETDVNRRAAEKRYEDSKALAKENTAAGLYARYVGNLTAPIGGAYTLYQAATGKAVDPYHPALLGQDIVRGQTAGFAGVSKGYTRELKQAGLGVFDFGTNAATFGALGLRGEALRKGVSGAFSTQALPSAAKDAAERGGTGMQAALSGVSSAALAYQIEKSGADRLAEIGRLKNAKGLIPAAAKSFLAEGVEEGLEEMGNILADMAIMREKNELFRLYNEAIAGGKTKAQAADIAFDAAKAQIGQSARVGALAGGFMGGGMAGLSRATGRNMLAEAGGIEDAGRTQQYDDIPAVQEQERFPDQRDGEAVFVKSGSRIAAKDQPITYQSLISKPDMKVTRINSHAIDGKTRNDIVEAALKAAKARNHPKNTTTETYLFNADLGKNVLIGKPGITHSLARRWKETGTMLTEFVPMFENAVVVNEIYPRENTAGGYVLLGYGMDENGAEYPAYFIVTEREVGGYEVEHVETLYASKAKKIEPSAKSANSKSAAMLLGNSPIHISGSIIISIEELLGKVNAMYSDILPKSVAEHFGHERRSTKLGNDVKFSLRETNNQEILAENERLAAYEQAGNRLYERYMHTLELERKQIEAGIRGTGGAEREVGVRLEEGAAATPAQMALANLVAEVGNMEVVLVDRIEQTIGHSGYSANGKYQGGRVYIAMDSESFNGTLFHESIHYIREVNPEGYDRAQKAVFEMAAALENKSVEEYKRDYEENLRKVYDTYDAVLEEMTADAFQRLAEDERSLRRLIRELEQREPTVLEQIGEFFEKLLETLKGLLRDARFSSFAEDIHRNVKNTERLQTIFADELRQAGEIRRGKTEGWSAQDIKTDKEKYSLNKKFPAQYDAWDGEKYIAFDIGITSDALQSIGIQSRKIKWHGEKIKKIKAKHPGMTDEVIKQVPQILENPVIVMKSAQMNKNGEESRITIFGEVNDANGVPVLAILELLPKKKNDSIINLQIIASAYGKTGGIKSFIENADVLYLDENKKRTDTWLKSFGLQLPSGITKYGSIGIVTYTDDSVNIYGVPYYSLIQRKKKT